jgi:hypothetical protein
MEPDEYIRAMRGGPAACLTPRTPRRPGRPLPEARLPILLLDYPAGNDTNGPPVPALDESSLDDFFDFLEQQEGQVVELDVTVDIPRESVTFLDSDPGELRTRIDLDCVDDEGRLCRFMQDYSLAIIDDETDLAMVASGLCDGHIRNSRAIVIEFARCSLR